MKSKKQSKQASWYKKLTARKGLPLIAGLITVGIVVLVGVIINNSSAGYRQIDTCTRSYPCTIRSAKDESLCLDIAYAALYSSGRLQYYPCHGGANQKFWFYRTSTASGGPYYHIYPAHSYIEGQCLEVAGASTANSATVNQNRCIPSNEGYFPHQQWSFRKQPNKYEEYSLVNRKSGKCAQAQGGSNLDVAASTRIVQYTCAFTDYFVGQHAYQRFNIMN